MHPVDCNYLETWLRKYIKLDISSSSFHFKWKKHISSRMPSQFPGSNELVNSNATAKYCIQHIFAVVSLVLRITTSCKEKYYLFTHLHTFKKNHPSFFHFKRKKPISSKKLLQFLVSLPMERTCKQQHEQYNCKVFIFNTICCCFISFENYSFLQGKIFT